MREGGKRKGGGRSERGEGGRREEVREGGRRKDRGKEIEG